MLGVGGMFHAPLVSDVEKILVTAGLRRDCISFFFGVGVICSAVEDHERTGKGEMCGE